MTASSGCQRISPSASPQTSPTGRPATQLAAGGLAADPAVEAGAQNVQFGLGHGALHAQQHPVIEQARMVDPVGVGDQRVGHPGQVQQPIPVGVVAGQPRHLQRQHDPDLAEPDLGGQLGEPGPAGGAGAADAEVVVDHPDRAARPAQLGGPRDEVVLAGGGLRVALELGQGGLADIDHRGPPQMRGGDLAVTHRRPPPSRWLRRLGDHRSQQRDRRGDGLGRQLLDHASAAAAAASPDADLVAN